MLTRRLLAAALITLTLLLPTQAQQDQTYQSAEWLLKKATLIHRDGLQNVLLRALRQMKDPTLKPLFTELSHRAHPTLQAHGILGLAEISDPLLVDLELIMAIQDPAVQAQVVSAALDTELLSLDQAKQLIDSTAIQTPIKVIAATVLAQHNQLTNTAPLEEASAPTANEALRATAALLQLQLNKPDALNTLTQIYNTPHLALAQREALATMLLQAANRHNFDAVAPFALQIAINDDTGRNLKLLALGTAIRFNAPDAPQLWLTNFDAATSPAERIRLAVLALDIADKLPPQYFQHLIEDQDPSIRLMGQVGQAVASGQPAIQPAAKLLDSNQVLAANWILKHARDLDPKTAEPLLIHIINHAEAKPNPARNRGRRLEHVVLAAEHLATEHPNPNPIFQQIFAKSPPLTQEAVLMGLIRADTNNNLADIIQSVKQFPSPTAESLALLLRLKNGATPTPKQLEDLQLIVMGGSGLQDPLRVQAAWTYLRLTSQDQVAITAIIRQ